MLEQDLDVSVVEHVKISHNVTHYHMKFANTFNGFALTLGVLYSLVGVVTFILLVRLIYTTGFTLFRPRKIFFALLMVTMCSIGILCLLVFALKIYGPHANPDNFETWEMWTFWNQLIFAFSYIVLLCTWADFYFIWSSARRRVAGVLSLSSVLLLAVGGVFLLLCVVFTIAEWTWANDDTLFTILSFAGSSIIIVIELSVCVGFGAFAVSLLMIQSSQSHNHPVRMNIFFASCIACIAFLFNAASQGGWLAAYIRFSKRSIFTPGIAALSLMFMEMLLCEVGLSFYMLYLLRDIPQPDEDQPLVIDPYTPILQRNNNYESTSIQVDD